MNLLSIYNNYKIPKNLQLHQLKVASIAKSILDTKILNEVISSEVLIACLLHDMGNILKFNLDIYPELLEPESKVYWQSVQTSFEKKYGIDESVATLKIISEIIDKEQATIFYGDKKSVVRLKNILQIVSSIGFSNAQKICIGDNLAFKIAVYSDMRVGIYGALPLQKRIEEGRLRRIKNKVTKNEADFETNYKALVKIESEIAEKCSFDIKNLKDSDLNEYVKNLRDIKIRL